MAVLEGWRVVEPRRHILDRLDDRFAAMASVDAKQSRRGVDHLAAVGFEIVDPLGPGKQSRPLLEGAVGGERHPVGLELIGLHVERGHGHLRGFSDEGYRSWLERGSAPGRRRLAAGWPEGGRGRAA